MYMILFNIWTRKCKQKYLEPKNLNNNLALNLTKGLGTTNLCSIGNAFSRYQFAEAWTGAVLILVALIAVA